MIKTQDFLVVGVFIILIGQSHVLSVQCSIAVLFLKVIVCLLFYLVNVQCTSKVINIYNSQKVRLGFKGLVKEQYNMVSI